MKRRQITQRSKDRLREARAATAPLTKRLRAAIKHIPDAWVRNYRNEFAWAGAKMGAGGAVRMNQIRAALEAAGFACECKGKPGTSGEFIVDINLSAQGESNGTP